MTDDHIVVHSKSRNKRYRAFNTLPVAAQRRTGGVTDWEAEDALRRCAPPAIRAVIRAIIRAVIRDPRRDQRRDQRHYSRRDP